MGNPKFSVGQAVRLAGSSIENLMTINHIETENTETHLAQFNGYYECIWLNAAKQVTTYKFKEEVLINASVSK